MPVVLPDGREVWGHLRTPAQDETGWELHKLGAGEAGRLLCSHSAVGELEACRS